MEIREAYDVMRKRIFGFRDSREDQIIFSGEILKNERKRYNRLDMMFFGEIGIVGLGGVVSIMGFTNDKPIQGLYIALGTAAIFGITEIGRRILKGKQNERLEYFRVDPERATEKYYGKRLEDFSNAENLGRSSVVLISAYASP